jgi:hypothetical protein
MFQLTYFEFQDWKSQLVISNSINMGLRKDLMPLPNLV